ncbi:hypothetical protein LIER_40874 [Lithospermum erythrorhizon]|uniref:Uncharacterized protein n=1 Tax=Lithospermum erythrorhizon TaxID=34254 RepID=A0AAV3R134_LITER
MCHPGGLEYPIGYRQRLPQRRLITHAETTVVVVPQQQPAAVNRNTNGATDGGGMECVCSPTRHPGSFRCRHHRSSYAWVCRSSTNQTE